MGRNLRTRKLGGWFTDFKRVTGDAVTGTVHVVAETARGAAAVATLDVDRVLDKANSVYDTVGQGIDTTKRVSGNIYDDAKSAKEKLNTPNVPPGYMVDDKTGEIVPIHVASSVYASRRGDSSSSSSSSSGLWLIAAGIAAKVLFFK